MFPDHGQGGNFPVCGTANPSGRRGLPAAREISLKMRAYSAIETGIFPLNKTKKKNVGPQNSTYRSTGEREG